MATKTREPETTLEEIGTFWGKPLAELSQVELLQAQRNVDARNKLIAEFGALRSHEIPQAAELERQGRVFSVFYRDANVYPAFQFDDEAQPRPVIAKILEIIAPHMKGWEIALWFTGSNGWLGGKRPVDRLIDDRERVIDAARREVEELAF